MSKFKVGDIVRVVDSPNDIAGMRNTVGKINTIVSIVEYDGMQFYQLTDKEDRFLWNENQLKLIDIPPITLQELISNIQKWSIDKELHEADPIKQTVKLVEELGELASGLLKDKKEVIVDSLGDMLVVLIILHQQLGLTMEETLEFAWNEIKDRKGEMKNGVFVKEEDL
ncbi:MAG TPA: MazG-like family protein [Bacilli bacterium]|nr:MazG-like family protein [Bacilli bacterium]